MLKSFLDKGEFVGNLEKNSGFFFSTIKESGKNTAKVNYYQIIYVTSGQAEFVTDKTYSLGIGSGFIIAPDFSFTINPAKNSLFRQILVDKTEFTDICNKISTDGSLLQHLNNNGQYLFNLSQTDVDFIENKLYSFYLYPEPLKKIGFINLILSTIIGSVCYSKNVKTTDSSEFSKKCITLCHSYFTDNEASEKIRNAFPYNDVYFGRKFKECFNCSLLEYLTNLRMETAKYYIINLPISMEEVCNMVGIYSVAHFIKLFKKFYGTTPYKFKAEHRKLYDIKGAK